MKNLLLKLVICVSVLLLSSCTRGENPILSEPTSNAGQIETPYLSEVTLPPDNTTSEEPSMNPTESLPTRQFEAYPGLPALRGVNLGNALDAPWPGVWGVTIKETLVQSVSSAGFNAIRVPVRFSAHTGPAPDYILSETILQSTDQVIQWGLDAGLVVILDVHHFDALLQAPAVEEARYLAIWDQLASRYRSLPTALYFELLNEPHGDLDGETWNRLIAESIQHIRQTNPTRTIIIGGLDYSTIDSLNDLVLPEDSHLAATFHYYEPFEFTHQGASWVSGATAWTGTTWDGTSAEVSAIEQAFDRAVDWSNEHQIPLILGEFGTIETAGAASRQAWTATVARAAEARGIPWFYWDLCTDFGVFDCEKSQWDEALMNALFP
jgi:endoglucanase